MALDVNSSSIYFQAAQSAAQTAAAQQAGKTSKENKTEKPNSRKGIFASLFEKAQQQVQFTQDGFPIEIADMDLEEAAVWLRDQADSAADVLKDHQTPDVFADYRKKVTNFMRYVVKHNLEFKKVRRSARRGVQREPHCQMKIINEKLDEMARWLINPANDIHRKTLRMLEKINELKGLLVDLYAS
ncbi:MAG: YaaR family protein [Treponema sp.]|nr:YaaR family protein [Spirochaetia bacterium]MDD7460527.1 YaaR family protein [Spirochaetales bacterium]MDY5812073.1 YaaR family protein [Treponema sp.]MEE1182435.1 YaaR family protein [Treponema sp.]